MGAQRWIDFKIFYFQPSELMKITCFGFGAVFSKFDYEDVGRSLVLVFRFSCWPSRLVGLRQPDLGTALSCYYLGEHFFYGWGGYGSLYHCCAWGGGIPIWQYLYTIKKRICLFGPKKILGAGYHLAPKIAMVAVVFGVRSRDAVAWIFYLKTDWLYFYNVGWRGGLVAGLGLMGLYISHMLGVSIAALSKPIWRLIAMGVMVNFSLFVLINMGMGMGLIPGLVCRYPWFLMVERRC